MFISINFVRLQKPFHYELNLKRKQSWACEVLKHVGYTELMQTAKQEDIQRLCDNAVYYKTAPICIPCIHQADR